MPGVKRLIPLAILTLPPHRPPLKNGPLPKINFFDVSDDFEQKINFKFGCTGTAPQG